PGSDGHHLDFGEPRRRIRCAARDRGRRAAGDVGSRQDSWMTTGVAKGSTQTRSALTAERVASTDLSDVFRWLNTSPDGLSSAEVSSRRSQFGPNSIRTHRVSMFAVLGRQLRNAVLWLLAGTAAVSFFLGDSTQAIIIGIILAASIGLGFVNEYRAERAAAELHSRVRHTTVVRRDGQFTQFD